MDDFQAVWEGLQSVNESDPSVLSLNPEDHIQKVLKGKYAYIGDNTKIHFRMSTECDLVTMKQELLPFQYAFGLPNNSPFTEMFSKEYVIHFNFFFSESVVRIAIQKLCNV